jgi:hypothetical protein
MSVMFSFPSRAPCAPPQHALSYSHPGFWSSFHAVCANYVMPHTLIITLQRHLNARIISIPANLLFNPCGRIHSPTRMQFSIILLKTAPISGICYGLRTGLMEINTCIIHLWIVAHGHTFVSLNISHFGPRL